MHRLEKEDLDTVKDKRSQTESIKEEREQSQDEEGEKR